MILEKFKLHRSSIFVKGFDWQIAEICKEYCKKTGLTASVTSNTQCDITGSNMGCEVKLHFKDDNQNIQRGSIKLAEHILQNIETKECTVVVPEDSVWIDIKK